MLTIGILGGVASGKSTVAGMLAKRGALLVDADQLAHQALASPEVIAQLLEHWGPGILGPDGQILRSKLAKRVFGDSAPAKSARQFLESVIHPQVRLAADQALHRHAQSGGQVAVLDIPLLLDVGWHKDCDLLLMVDSPQTARLARAENRGWNAEQLASREASQRSIAEKKDSAHVVIENQGDLVELANRVDEFWDREVRARLAR